MSTRTTSILTLLTLALLHPTQAEVNNDPCPGVLNVVSSTTECCVGGSLTFAPLSSCPGWPICTGPVSTTFSTPPVSCATIIVETGGGAAFTSACDSASESLANSGTTYRTTLNTGGSVVQTATPGSSGGSAATTSAASAASSVASAASSGNAALAVSAGPFGVLGGLLVLLGML